MISIRGAITVDKNSKEDILEATKEVLTGIIDKNGICKEEIISITFTGTDDLTKVYPAVAAREVGITDASLLCMQEMFIEGSLRMCVRVLMCVNSEKLQKEARHIYLKGAKVLRPDLSE